MTTEDRLRRLEIQVRRMRWVIIVLLMIGAGAVIFSVTQREDVPQVIRAQSFEVIGDNGRVAAKMGHQASNGGVWVFNDQGYSAAFLTTDEFGAGSVTTFNGKDPRKPQGTVLFTLASDEASHAVMRILHEKGNGLLLEGDDGTGAGGRIETLNNEASVVVAWP
ncbi:MAG: hypothetical protein V3T53_05115 [Phycisphaerales bacterium]